MTSVAGCAADLVENEWNDYIVPPTDPYAAEGYDERLARGNEVRQQMSVRSYERIRAFSPQACANGLAAAALTAERRSR